MNFDNKNIITKSNKAIVTNQIPKKNNDLAIASLVFGIISLLSCWIIIVPIITGIIGVITGCISIIKKRKGQNIAIAGIALSILCLLIGIFIFILFIIGTLVS